MLANLDAFGDEDGRAQVTLCYTPDSVIPCRSPNRNCGVIARMFMPSHSHESRVNAFPYGIREEVQPRYTKPRAAACYKCGPSLIFLLSSLRISIRFIAIHIRAIGTHHHPAKTNTPLATTYLCQNSLFRFLTPPDSSEYLLRLL